MPSTSHLTPHPNPNPAPMQTRDKGSTGLEGLSLSKRRVPAGPPRGRKHALASDPRHREQKQAAPGAAKTSVDVRNEKLQQLRAIAERIQDDMEVQTKQKEALQEDLREGMAAGRLSTDVENALIEDITAKKEKLNGMEEDLAAVVEAARQLQAERFSAASKPTAKSAAYAARVQAEGGSRSVYGRKITREMGLSGAQARSAALEEGSVPDTFWLTREELNAIEEQNKKWRMMAREDPANAAVYLARVRDVGDAIALHEEEAMEDLAFRPPETESMRAARQLQAEMLAQKLR